MSYSEYINEIRFRFYSPSSQLRGYFKLTEMLKLFNISLEILNTSLPPQASLVRSHLRALCEIPKMSTYAIAAMINYGVSCLSPNSCFVNVGIWHGFTFFSGIVGNPKKTCIGVDNFSQFGGPRTSFATKFDRYKGPNHHFFEMDYIDYFSKIHKKPIGFYLYDGDHSYENQLLGLQTAEPFFSKNCILMVDDTNWDEPRQATLDFMNNSKGKYQILLDAITHGNQHPTWWNGIMVLQKME